MNRERLEDLIYLLRNIRTELPALDLFDMQLFHDTDCPSSDTAVKLKEEGFCNTAACALGSAALWPKFQKQGLFIDDEDNCITFGEHVDFDAGQYFFEITNLESLQIFSVEDDTKLTPEIVADNIEKLFDL